MWWGLKYPRLTRKLIGLKRRGKPNQFIKKKQLNCAVPGSPDERAAPGDKFYPSPPPVISRTKARRETRKTTIESFQRENSHQFENCLSKVTCKVSSKVKCTSFRIIRLLDRIIGYRRLKTVISNQPKISLNAPKFKENILFTFHGYSKCWSRSNGVHKMSR